MIQGSARGALLESYQAERRAIALANTALSVANWEEALKVPRALGLNPAAAQLLHSAVSSRAASLLPSGIIPCWHVPICSALWQSFARPTLLLGALVLACSCTALVMTCDGA